MSTKIEEVVLGSDGLGIETFDELGPLGGNSALRLC